MSESGPSPSPGDNKPRGYDQPKARVGRPIFESGHTIPPAQPQPAKPQPQPQAAKPQHARPKAASPQPARSARKPRPSLFELAAPAEHQPAAAQQPPAAPDVHDHVDPALSSVSHTPIRRTVPTRRRSRTVLHLVLAIAMAAISIACGFGAWQETGHIRQGGQTLSDWIKNEILPMPRGVSPHAAIIRPRQYLRLANFTGQPQYSFELWAPTPDGEELVGKYLIAPQGDGAYRLLAAYDVRRQRSLNIPEALD